MRWIGLTSVKAKKAEARRHGAVGLILIDGRLCLLMLSNYVRSALHSKAYAPTVDSKSDVVEYEDINTIS